MKEIPAKAVEGSPEADRRASLMQRIRVPLGFAFAAVYAVFAQPNWQSLYPGIAVALIGLAIRLWSAGYLRKHRELCVSGPYRWTRNPLYLGSFLLGAGFSVAAAKPWILILFLILFFAIYVPVMRKEEAELARAYGIQYEEYKKKVPVFFPALRPCLVSTGRNFSLDQTILNKEYKAIVGFLIVFVFLLVKLMWP
jgi:protein-S-isoprenylcysteine O-methyltransferase Ste14